jgi:hypothetical protein
MLAVLIVDTSKGLSVAWVIQINRGMFFCILMKFVVFFQFMGQVDFEICRILSPFFLT